MNINGETWKYVPGFSNYMISDHGNIKNKKTGRNLSHILRKGYHGATLYDKDKYKTVRIHALMVRVFENNFDMDLVAAHIDGNKDNNNLSNIKLITQYENIQHKRKHGTMAIGERNYNTKFTIGQILKIKSLIKNKKTNKLSNKKIADMYGVCENAIYNIISGKAYSYIKESE